ncbi:MAG: AAA family ATPase [Nanoarchaeota archaeon]|nr:AAA family ATPase [Nanoarchaeota archaeon]MCG2718003.1 AAA family ATPase [Nanoarchaeota archaeon]
MAINRIRIENFRSIKKLDLEPTMLTALIGRNNVGKSNILSAIELLLGEKWPPYAIKEDDIYNHDEHLTGKIELYFNDPIIHPYYGRDIKIDGFRLEFDATHGGNLSCVDDSGNEVLTQYGKPLNLSNAIRNKIPAVLVSVNRDLSKILSASQWTILGKILKDISEEFKGDEGKVREFNQKMEEATKILKIDNFKKLEEIIVDNVKRLTGFYEVGIQFKEPHILGHYQNLQLIVRESPEYREFSALEMGAGIQSAIVVALINAYKILKRTGAVLLIEEPEVYLHPHARRYFYSLLRKLSDEGTQVFYTTHSAEFIDLDRYEHVNIVRKDPSQGTYICQGRSISIDPTSREQLKLSTEFDAKRNELFFAERVLLAEGDTEENALPYLFLLKGIDIDKENISIINAKSVTNIKFFVKILRSFRIPFVVLMDTHSNKSNYHDYYVPLNRDIVSAVGDENLVFLFDSDFETIFGLPTTGDKVRNAIEKVKSMKLDEIPKVVNDAIDKLKEL